MSLKQSFFDSVKTETKKLAFLPEGLLIRSLTCAERSVIKSMWLKSMNGAKSVTAIPSGIDAKTVLFGLINDDGSQALQEQDLPGLLASSGGKIGRIYEEINKISEMDDGSAERAEKNSEAIQSD